MATAFDTYLPYDAGAGANVAEDGWRKMGRFFVPSMVVAHLNHLKPFGDSSGMQVKVDTGAAMIQGQYGESPTSSKILPIASVSGIAGGQSRLDRLIARNDFVSNQMVFDVLTGTPAVSPVEPALTQSSSLWEIALAKVGPLTNATATISAGLVIDERQVYAPLGHPFHAEVYQANAQTVVNNTVTILGYDTVESDPSGMVTTGASFHITVPFPGRWMVLAGVNWAGGVGVGQFAGIFLFKNGSEHRRGDQTGGTANTMAELSLKAIARCSTAGDTLDIRINQLTGGNLATTAGAALTYAQFTYLGPL